MRLCAFALVAACALGVSNAQASSKEPRFLVAGKVVAPPHGWHAFCKTEPQDCLRVPDPLMRTPALEMNADTLSKLQAVNDLVNTSVQPLSDQKNYGVPEWWAYPHKGWGDCEDYVLLKRRWLTSFFGFPPEALLITVVWDPKDMSQGHAVLTVVTSEGDYVLDNQLPQVMLWFKTGYRFRYRQSQEDPNVWVSLNAPGPLSVATFR